MLNYHELTMNEPRDSPQRRKQFLVICVIGACVMLNSLFNAGLFVTMDITEGVFPGSPSGGLFVFKTVVKDINASYGSLRRLAHDLTLSHTDDWGDVLYNVYLDEEGKISKGRTRYLTGVMLPKDQKDTKKELYDIEYVDLDDGKYWKTATYEEGRLPKVKAAVVHFPYTNGFLSALINTYRVIPALLKYAKEKGDGKSTPVVITTCSIQQEMCTHYATLTKGKDFLLGKVDTDTYAKMLEEKDSKGKKKGESEEL